MNKILICPFAQNLRNGKVNPKNYPYWAELIKLIKEKHVIKIVQIGSTKDPRLSGVDDFLINKSFLEIRQLIKEYDTWISVDTFIQHLNHYYDCKPGIVIWSRSDPKIFGYGENTNLLKDKKYLREKQFWLWEQCEYDSDAYVAPDVVYSTLVKLLKL